MDDDRSFEEPGFTLEDDAVKSLFHIWRVDEETRQAAFQWMTEYMQKVGVSEDVEERETMMRKLS